MSILGANEHDLTDGIEFGRKADALLADPTLARAFADVEQAIVDAWKRCATGDTETQVHCRLALSALNRVRDTLRGYVQTGVVNEKLLERERKKRLFAVR